MAEAAHFLPARLSDRRTHLRERIGHICLKGNQATGDPELRSCVKLKVEVAVMGHPSPVLLTVSVDVKQH